MMVLVSGKERTRKQWKQSTKLQVCGFRTSHRFRTISAPASSRVSSADLGRNNSTYTPRTQIRQRPRVECYGSKRIAWNDHRCRCHVRFWRALAAARLVSRSSIPPAWLRFSLLFMGIVLGASIATLAVRASGLPLHATPLTAQQVAINREIGRHFYLIFGAEVAAIFLVVAVLRIIHHPTYILCGVALIVGVHFVPLAALFKSPIFYGTGLGGCAIGLGGFFIADDGFRQKVVGISFGLLLWATAAWIALIASKL